MSYSVTEYNGEQKSLTEWARQYGITVPSFAAWVRDHAIDNAIMLAQMDYWDRKAWRKEQKAKMDAVQPAEEFDEDLEYKNRLYYWQQKGMTPKEIEIKARML